MIKNMKTCNSVFILAACALLAGCVSTRSISNSDYREPGAASSSGHSDPGFAYRGELSEFDILGVARDQTAFEEDIQQALDKARPIRLKPNSTILLIQSGAMFPDGPMVAELSKHFTVVSFSGRPPARDSIDSLETRDSAALSRSLRLAAARAGAGLKLALVDVRSGDWSVLSPPPFDSQALSVGPRRAVTDQKLVERLKDQAYDASVRELLRVYSDESASANRAKRCANEGDAAVKKSSSRRKEALELFLIFWDKCRVPCVYVQVSLNPAAIGNRAARIAGNSPPTKPISADQITPRTSSSGVTLNANVTWLKLWRFIVEV